MGELTECLKSIQVYHSLVDKRLAALPADVVEGLRPDRIAHEINESLRQQFMQSTLPQTAKAMTAVAAELRQSVTDFGQSVAILNHAHRGAAENARQVIEKLDRTVSAAAHTARVAAEQLSSSFLRELRWSVYTLVTLVLVFGLGAGLLLDRWLIVPPDPPASSAPAIRNAPSKAKRVPAE
jgi:hypothetical protein